MPLRRICHGALWGLLLWAAIAFGAPVTLDLPAQPLAESLKQLARAAGVTIAVDTALVAGKTAPAIKGTLEPGEALRRLLAGSGLEAVPGAGGSFVVRRTAPSPAVEQRLPEVTVRGREIGESASGPVEGYVATRSATGTKTDTPILETPQSVSVITRERIEDQGAQSLQEALRYSAGVQSEPFGFEPRLPFIRIRGFDVSDFGLYRDGLQLANPGFNALGFASYNPEIYGVERVEVLKGPASILYGQGNPGGLVNLVSKRPSLRPLREVELEAGSFDHLAGKFDLGGPVAEGGEVFFRLTGLARDGETQVDFIQNDRLFFAPALTWQPDEGTRLTLLAHYQKDETRTSQRLPLAGTLRPNPNGKVPTERFLGEPGVDRYNRRELSLGYELEQRLTDRLVFQQSGRYLKGDLDHVQIFGLFLQADQRTLERGVFASDGGVEGFVLDTRLQYDFATGAFAHRLLAGVDYQHADAEAAQGFASAQAFGGTTPAIDVFDPVYGSPTPLPARVDNAARQEQVGLYLQDQVEYGRWILGLNGRYDWAKTELQDRLFFTAGGDSRQEDEEFTGRVGLLYRFPFGLAPYASYSTSFLPAIGSDPGGRPFEPEKAKQYEAGVKFQPPGSRSFLSVTYFDLTRENFIQSNPLTFVQEQTGEVRSRGVELEGVANFPFGLDLIASYSWLDAEITRSNDPAEIGARPTQTPRQLASLWAQYRLFGGPVRGLGVGAGVRHIGAQFGDTPNTVKVPSVTLVDAALFYDWGRVRLAVNAHNLFDKEYVAAAFGSFATYGLRRTVIGSLRYRW